jgi:ankyrin repeat protein
MKEIIDLMMNNEFQFISEALKNNANIHKSNSSGISPIHFAASTTNIELIQLLIANKADVKMKMENEGQNTPLHIAAISGTPETIELFIKHGAEINSTDAWGWTPLMLAISEEKTKNVETLLNFNASCTQKNEEGLNALHLATKTESSLTLCEMILDKDVNATLGQDHTGRTPLQYAIKYERQELCDLILKYNHKCWEIKDGKGNNALEYGRVLKSNLNEFLEKRIELYSLFESYLKIHLKKFK